MSHSNGPPGSSGYDPLPLGNNDHPADIRYNPPSPGPSALSFNPYQNESQEIIPDPGPPQGTAQPRFFGPALYSEVGAPHSRDSYVSSQGPSLAGSVYSGSVYALNDRPFESQSYDDQGYRDDPYFATNQGGMPLSPVGRNRILEEKNAVYARPSGVSRRRFLSWAIIAILGLIIAVGVPVYFAVIRPKFASSHPGSSTAAHPSSTSAPASKSAITGGDGSTVTMDDGTTFIYHNSFGGYWYWDPEDPFNNGAKAQSFTPALNETFNYGSDRIKGVNIGGWLNTEPFISPALYEQYVNTSSPAVDEWTLSLAMAADTANGGLNQLENHYKTFITEQDFAQIAGAGLNYVRIPLPYWAIETRTGEPFLPQVSWTYFLKAIKWARKYGLRINLDFHALPGSQNGWNHSGRLGTINVLNGPMGIANAQRSLDYIRILAEFISQPQYSSVVTMFGVTNEPQGPSIGQPPLSSFYLQAYNIVREASGVGAGNGPFISFHDGFFSRTQWAGFLTGADRISLDSHPYICFDGQSSAPMSSYATTPCSTWGSTVNTSMGAFGLSTNGEFSNAVTDCGLWVNGVNQGARYDGTYVSGGPWPVEGSCIPWTDWQNYSPEMITGLQNFAMASMDALQNWFFWTWKIGNSSVTGKVESPAWSYQLGLQQGWMPNDPRQAYGVCGNSNPWTPPLSAWQTGGSGAGNIPASETANLPWPPASISGGGAFTLLPSYTPTGVVPTLPPPTFTLTAAGSTASAGNGWENPSDTAGLMVPISTCSYLDPWVGAANPPSPLCTGSAARDVDEGDAVVVPPLVTPAPSG